MTDQATPAKKPPLKIRLKRLTEQYGKVALYTYLALSLSAVSASAAAARMMWRCCSMLSSCAAFAASSAARASRFWVSS